MEFTKAEERFTLALDGNEKSLGKDHFSTNFCAKNLGKLYYKSKLNDKEKMRSVAARYPHLTQGSSYIRSFFA